ncbi:hypothetical protein MCHI_002954 [Candidatus Magnetoovum chiemensis]|nr:hypothetical protein MCHI_002954 [Candidatus Magnetoovum chiemensis]
MLAILLLAVFLRVQRCGWQRLNLRKCDKLVFIVSYRLPISQG